MDSNVSSKRQVERTLVEVQPMQSKYCSVIYTAYIEPQFITKTPLNSKTIERQSVEKEIAAVEITKRVVASARFLFIPTTGL